MTEAPEPQAPNPRPDIIAESAPGPSKTPLYQAINASRYQRQALIRRIQDRHQRRLICYVAGGVAPVSRDDAIGFVDLLHNIQGPADIDLMLHTGGGDVDAAEKLINMVRAKVENHTLRVVVPDFAKSAGTLMSLGADRIVMSDASELGPIDPQVLLADGNGNKIWHSVLNYLDAFDHFNGLLKESPDDVAARMMLGKMDPATYKLFEAVKDRARKFAEEQLKRGMFLKQGGNWSQAVSALIDNKRWRTHGQMISWQDASDPKMGLQVEYLPPDSEEWQEYWQLYCMQRLSITDRQKLFESDYVSIPIDI